MKSLKWFFSIVVIFSTLGLFSDEMVHEIINNEFGRRDIEFIITTSENVDRKKYKEENNEFIPENLYYYLIEGIGSVTVIDSIYIRIRDIEYNVPKNYYYDIIWPHIKSIESAYISIDNGSFVIKVSCGDGGAGYFVVYMFNDKKEIKRFFMYYDEYYMGGKRKYTKTE